MIEFVENPTDGCWVLYPLIVCNLNTKGTFRLKCQYFNVPSAKLTNPDIPEIVEDVVNFETIKDRPVAFRSSPNDWVIMACTLSRLLRISSIQALCMIKTAHYTIGSRLLLPQYSIDRILEYQHPLVVLVCGDRGSGTIFGEMMTYEFAKLPSYSVIVHGGCRGVDVYAGKVAKSMGVKVKVYDAKWDEFHLAAGPIRNTEMLVSEKPDMVLAFHPDITLSKGTANMMMQAYDAGVSVWLYDLKRKVKYEGQDFGEM